MTDLKNKVIEAYRDGSDLNYIVDCFKITYSEVKRILIDFKDANRTNRTFADELKIVIAERDINGVARSTIAKELDLNVNTVKKACAKFGNALKEKSVSNQAYTHIEGSFDLKTCPTCDSSRVNEVDENAIYCKTCGNEFFKNGKYTYRINWEYLD